MTARRRNPWWIPAFLGRVPAELGDGHLRLLGALSLALLFEEYDNAMLTSALKQIAAELGMIERDFGLYMGLIRLGALPAIVFIPFADRVGRRPVFIASVMAMGAITFATAFVRTPVEFVIAQAMTRTFFVAGSTIAFVIITEEFPASVRGWGIGMLAALGAMGHGLSAAMYAQVDRLPYGWRSLYVLGAAPILFYSYFRAQIRETTRFSNASGGQPAASAGGLRAAWEPLRELAVAHPGRAFGIALTGYAAAVGTLPSFQFSSYFVQEKLGWTPANYSTMMIVAGGVGIIGNIVAGRLGDAFGRKRVGFVLLSLFPVASFTYYHGSSWVVVVAWVALVFCLMGGRVMQRALAAELFPTEYRGAASGLFSVLETLGAVTGLLVIYFYGTENVDDLSWAVPLVGVSVFVAAAVLLFFPETGNRELEAIH